MEFKILRPIQEKRYYLHQLILGSFMIMKIILKDYYKDTYYFLIKCNKITATAYCPAIDVIITADSGSDSMMVVWDAKTGNPLKTIFEYI